MRLPYADTSITDEELVSKIVATKDSELFAVLYDRYAKLVYNKCLSFSKSKEEAHDLTHDIFVLLFVKLKTFKGKSKFSTWLYSMTYNFCVNYVQREKKKREEKILVTDSIGDYEKAQVSDLELFSVPAETLEKALNLCKPEDKMILLLKYQDELPIKEIATALGLGESAVKMRINRAKARIIEIYKSL
ncbi:sigma-70 family RNA polymerase sigma factor [Aureisphaera galaxeae]|uniref:RNA polymerase sigma factor n=1 Tax=Aureisphaera galaxeae TaxID=1538023 RepID=UPI002350AD5D|nr:sigma-70 family RNA polymerase sigma factor [Aureisphaera galaxeae]MDC8003511.1 sigma-70 family RNA polymerase sigma factor [Aureisphaera galaxeae]